MSLSVGRVEAQSFHDIELQKIRTNRSASFVSNTYGKFSSNINLNNNPAAISFTGLFSKKQKEEPKPAPLEPRIYGPYKMTISEVKNNDTDVYNVLKPIAEGLTYNTDENLNDLSHDRGRATDRALKLTVPVTISALACYTNSVTSYPEFYDAMARSFPKACARLDKEEGTGNMAKIYERVTGKIEKYGKIANPNTEDPLEDGIRYLYFANNIPLLVESRKHGIECTDDLFEKMKEGYIPNLSTVKGAPRCHMSKFENEIDYYGTPYIKEHFSSEVKTDENGKEVFCNLNGCKHNTNHRNKRIKEPLADDIFEKKKTHWLLEPIPYDPSNPFMVSPDADIVEPMC